MKPIFGSALLLLSPLAMGAEWVLLASDALNSTYLDAAAVSRNAANETRFQIKLVYKRKRDMMGLPYDSATKDYVIVCDSNRILATRHLLLDGDQIVWVFPPTHESMRADAELPGEVLNAVCG